VAPTAAATPMVAVAAGFTAAVVPIAAVAVGSTSAAADTPVAKVFAAGAQRHRVKRVAHPADLVDCLRGRQAIPLSSEAAPPPRTARVI
jgi:hypothetical protein